MEIKDNHLAEQVRQLALNKFYYFVKAFWHTLEPAPFQEQDYLEGICKHVEKIFDVGKLIVNKPPRHGVSQVISVMAPAWWLAKDPSLRFLIASYALSVSSGYTERTRRILESPLYKQLFPHVQSTTSTRDLIETSRNGMIKAVSVDAGTLAEGANIIIFDDPNNSNQIGSQAHCKSVIDYWEGTLSTRINAGRAGARVIVQQRLGFTDLSQYLLDRYKDWHHLNLPYEADAETYQSKWWSDKRTPGEPLSTLLTVNELADRKANPWRWATQFNQKPRSREGSIFTKLNFWTKKDDNYHCGDKIIPVSELTIYSSSDLAISERSTADWTVMQIWGAWKNYLILLHQFRGRVNSTAMLETFAALYAQWHCKFIGVEDVAFQRMAIQQLRERGLLVKAFKPTGDKVSRTLEAQLKNEAGELWLPENPEMEDELCSFPNGRFDDVVDALSMGVILGCKYARWKPTPPPLTEEELKAKADVWEKKEFARLMMQGT